MRQFNNQGCGWWRVRCGERQGNYCQENGANEKAPETAKKKKKYIFTFQGGTNAQVSSHRARMVSQMGHLCRVISKYLQDSIGSVKDKLMLSWISLQHDFWFNQDRKFKNIWNEAFLAAFVREKDSIPKHQEILKSRYCNIKDNFYNKKNQQD